MPTQEEYNALQVEYQIAEDNEARDRARLEQYEKVFAALQEMPREKLRDANVAPVIREALADYQATRERYQQSMARMASAGLALNEYEKNMAAQQAQAAAPWTRRKTVVPEKPIIVPQPNVNPNPTPNTNGRNPYLSLYSLYAQEIADNWNPSAVFQNLRVSPQQISNWLLDAWLTLQQTSDFMNDWQKYRPDVNLTSNQWTNTVPRRKLNTWGSGNGTLI